MNDTSIASIEPPDRRRRQLAGQQQIDGLRRSWRGPSARRGSSRARGSGWARCDVSAVDHGSRPGGPDRRLSRAIQAIPEVAEARQDELLRVEAAIDDRREDLHLRVRAASTAAMPSGAATMQSRRMSSAPAFSSIVIAATALPPVASIGSTISAVLDDRSAGSFEVVLRRDGGVLVALQSDVPDARIGQHLEHRVHHARARRAAPARRRRSRRAPRPGPARAASRPAPASSAASASLRSRG